jgi:Protein of unknown function (DUF1559)
MRDQFVRYLLGELNSSEREQLEAQLRDSPEMQREFDYLRNCLSGGCDEAELDPPPAEDAPRGLAARTLGRICGDEPCGDIAHSPTEIAAAYAGPAGTPSWSLADITVAGGVFLAISMLFVPALRQSRDAARRTGCANNLRQLGVMLEGYSDQHGRFFPMVARNQNAGIFAVYLLEEEYAGPDELSRLLLCRSSPLAEDVAENQMLIRVPTMCELASASCKQRKAWIQLMGGSYAYRMGYYEGDRYCAIRNERSCRKAVLADAPAGKLNCSTSPSHGGCGQNVLYEDGCVRFQKEAMAPEVTGDIIYLNDIGKEAAGLDRNDTVLGRSEATPGQPPASRTQ